MYGYIYLITNRVNGKIYVGQHKYDKMELDPTYHGSGTMLHKAYNKYGMDKFDTTLIDTGDTLEELNQKEIFYIDVLDCRNPDVGYNIAEGGAGGSFPGEKNPFYGKHHTDETRQKLSEAKTGEKHPMYGKHQSEDTKQRISEAHTGKTLTEEHKQKISEAHTGKTLTEEHKQKLSEASKGKPKSEEHKQKISEAKTGDKNPMSKKCPYNGIIFGSKKDAYNYAKTQGYDKAYGTFCNQFK